MMSYIKKNLLENEKIIYRGHKHWVVFAFPALWLFAGIASLFEVTLLQKIAIIPFLLSLITGIDSAIEYFMSEIAVTNKRILIKIGFIRRATIEAPLQNIASIQVDQTFWGRIWGYGSIKLCDIGHLCLPFERISSPVQFRRHAQTEIDKQPKFTQK